MSDAKWVIIIMLILWGLGVFTGAMLGDALSGKRHAEDIVGTELLSINCSDKGCSVLAEYKDRTREWIWIPKIVNK